MLFGHNGIAQGIPTRKTLAAQGTGRRDQTDGQTARQKQAADKAEPAGQGGKRTERADGRMDG